MFGFLGGNGAGKTTSLRMALDIIRPTERRASKCSAARRAARTRAEIGFLPEERGLYRQMTALDTIVYFGRLKGMTAGDAQREGAALLDRFGLADNAQDDRRQAVQGHGAEGPARDRAGQPPRLLILDEPFSGLDPVNQGLLEDEIRRISATGSTVVFSTHVMQHAERLCDRLLLLARGRKKFEGTLDEARAAIARAAVRSSRSRSRSDRQASKAPRRSGAAEDGWQRLGRRSSTPASRRGDVLERCIASSFPLRRFEQRRASLHDIFVHIVGPAEARP